MQEGAESLQQKEGLGGPLFQRLCPYAARDRGRAPTGSNAQARELLEALRADSLTKGPKVALRRRFSWLQGAQSFDARWHSVLIVILYTGMKLGVYKRYTSTPLWAGCDAKPSGLDDDDDDHDSDAADEPGEKATASAAKSAGSAATKKSEEPDPDTRAVKRGNEEVKQLRKKCKNTFLSWLGPFWRSPSCSL